MNPIFLQIGAFQIHWYSVILLFAFVVGIFLAILQAKKENINKEIIYDYVVYLIPLCLIGARIYYVLFNLNYYMNDPVSILKIWEGGLAIHGGLIAGIIFTYFYTRKRNIMLLKFLDIFVISLIIGQVIGRWGNFMNGEAYGPIVSHETLAALYIPEFIINGLFIDGNYHHPTFLYESLWNFVGVIILLIIRKRKFYHYGYLTAGYMIWYGIGRIFIEALRQDSLFLGNFKIAQIVSGIMVLFGIALIIWIRKTKLTQKQ